MTPSTNAQQRKARVPTPTRSRISGAGRSKNVIFGILMRSALSCGVPSYEQGFGGAQGAQGSSGSSGNSTGLDVNRPRIAFASDRSGNREIYAMHAVDGSNPTRLTNHSSDDTSPVWSA